MYHWPSEELRSQVKAFVRKLDTSPPERKRSGKVVRTQSLSSLLIAALADSQAPRVGNGVSVSCAVAAVGTPRVPASKIIANRFITSSSIAAIDRETGAWRARARRRNRP